MKSREVASRISPRMEFIRHSCGGQIDTDFGLDHHFTAVSKTVNVPDFLNGFLVMDLRVGVF
jgi:hypothetical protein